MRMNLSTTNLRMKAMLHDETLHCLIQMLNFSLKLSFFEISGTTLKQLIEKNELKNEKYDY